MAHEVVDERFMSARELKQRRKDEKKEKRDDRKTRKDEKLLEAVKMVSARGLDPDPAGSKPKFSERERRLGKRKRDKP